MLQWALVAGGSPRFFLLAGFRHLPEVRDYPALESLGCVRHDLVEFDQDGAERGII